MTRRLIVAGVCAAAALPGSAQAAGIGLETRPGQSEPNLVFQAAAGEANRLAVAFEGSGATRVTDPAVPVIAGDGCTQVSPNEALCATDASLVVFAGDEGDSVTAEGGASERLVVDAGAGDMGEGEVRVGRNRPVERLDGARPGGKHRVMRLAIGRSRRIRGCGERQVVSIAPHGGFSCASRQESIAAATPGGQPARGSRRRWNCTGGVVY